MARKPARKSSPAVLFGPFVETTVNAKARGKGNGIRGAGEGWKVGGKVGKRRWRCLVESRNLRFVLSSSLAYSLFALPLTPFLSLSLCRRPCLFVFNQKEKHSFIDFRLFLDTKATTTTTTKFTCLSNEWCYVCVCVCECCVCVSM